MLSKCNECPQEPMTSCEVVDMFLQDQGMQTEQMIVFPDIEESWFTNGLPGQVDSADSTAQGVLLDFFPIDVISKELFLEDPFPFAVNNAVGYIDEFGRYTPIAPELLYNVEIGDRAVTILLRSNDPILAGSSLTFNAFWNKVADWGILPADNSFNTQVRLSYGLNITNSIGVSFAIGQTIRGDLLEVISQLNEELFISFDKDFELQPYAVLNESINFPQSMIQRRLGLYQLIYFFGSVFGDELTRLSNIQQFDPNELGYYIQSAYTFNYLTTTFEQVEVPQPLGTGTVNLMYQ